ncbi:MAG TPA: hypothetical protein ENK62_06630 [Chromatiales bacterium]|nr:hypothetical protein [Chromatiales bacterium]
MRPSDLSTDPRYLRFLGLGPELGAEERARALAEADRDPKGYVLRTPCGLTDECPHAERCPRRHRTARDIRTDATEDIDIRLPEREYKLPVRTVERVQVILVPHHLDATACRLVTEALFAAAGSVWIRGILIMISSCSGGPVTPHFEGLMALLDAMRGEVPIVAHIETQASSAAYILASAAHLVLAARRAKVGVLGSICFICAGGEPQILSTTPHKRRAAFAYGTPRIRPMPFQKEYLDDVRKYLEADHDNTVRRIVRFRELPEEHVRRHIADGRTFQARKALRRGMVDRVVPGWREALAIASEFIHRRGSPDASPHPKEEVRA